MPPGAAAAGLLTMFLGPGPNPGGPGPLSGVSGPGSPSAARRRRRTSSSDSTIPLRRPRRYGLIDSARHVINAT